MAPEFFVPVRIGEFCIWLVIIVIGAAYTKLLYMLNFEMSQVVL